MTDKLERDFKGVWIPKEIWLDENLNWSEKILLTEIDSLTKNFECFASNEYFAKFIGISKGRVSKIITRLRAKGYIEIKLVYKDGTKQLEKRLITTRGYRREQPEGIGANDYRGIGANDQDINTIYINTNNKDIYVPPCPKSNKNFVIPTLDEVKKYIAENNYNVDAERFVDYYTAVGWEVGKKKMKDWKAAVRNWNGREKEKKVVEQKPTGNEFATKERDLNYLIE